MKTLIFLITIITATSLVRAGENHEVIWETEPILGRSAISLSPNNDFLFVAVGSIIQKRSTTDGRLLDIIEIEDLSFDILNISISNDGNLLALSGNSPYIYLYSLVDQSIINKLTAVVYERQEGDKFVVYNTDKWVSSSISPDGTKLTGIAKNEDVYDKTNLVIIEIESGKILFEERRISYDSFNPSDYSPDWRSVEYSKDGTKIVAQLVYRTPNSDNPDSVYIFKADIFKLDTILENTYSSSDNSFYLNLKSNKLFLTNNKELTIFSFEDRQTETFELGKEPRNLIFSYNYSKIILRLGVEYPRIFDYKHNTFSDEIKIYKGIPKITTSQDQVIYIGVDSRISLIDIVWENISGVYSSNNNKSTIAPNPTTGDINIKLNNQIPSNFNFELISLSGQIVKTYVLGFITHDNQNISLNISEVANGQYTLRIYSEQEEFSFSIIKEG
jgi:hypothetical protein